MGVTMERPGSRPLVISILALVSSFGLVTGGHLPVSSPTGLSSFAAPQNEYEYSLQRDDMFEKELELAGIPTTLSPDERVVAEYLQWLAGEEFQATKKSGFHPSRPIEEVMDDIQNTELYRVLRLMPKGANLHSHENHEVSKKTLFDIVWASEDFRHLWTLPDGAVVDFFINPPSPDWINVKDANITQEEMLRNQTLLGVLSDVAKKYPSDTGLRWTDLDPLWIRSSTQLIANQKIKGPYLEALLNQARADNVQYLETRKNFGPDERIYELDPSGDHNDTNGKVFLDEGGDLDIAMAKNITRKFLDDHPGEFVGFRRITYTTRFSSPEDVMDYMMHALALHQRYPNHVVGFDLVAHEDAGHSHLYFVGNLINDTFRGKMPLYMHTSETNWPDTMMYSDLPQDITPAEQNTYDAILLGSRRIGHGLGYTKHPYLLQLLKDSQTAIETCPVSNSILGYYPDIRNHPVRHHLRNGIPIVLGADDPGSFGYDHFTIDWYQAFLGWGLQLYELKQLSTNGLQYSSLSDQEKADAIGNVWQPSWDGFINSVKSEACDKSFNEQETVLRLFPREGSINVETQVHIYGRHFEKAICKTPKCRFGSTDVNAVFRSTTHLICVIPAASARTVSVSLDPGDGNFKDTGLTFEYKHVAAVTAKASSLCCHLILTYLLVLHVAISFAERK